MIIVEGMDNTGKSTLIRRLGEDLHLTQVRHSPKLPWVSSDLMQYLWALGNFDRGMMGKIILDRWPPVSEMVYSKVLRGGCNWDLRSHYRGEHLVIWCNPSEEVVLSFGNRPQMDGVIEKGKELIKAYKLEMEFLAAHFPVIEYNYVTSHYSTVCNAVREHLEK